MRKVIMGMSSLLIVGCATIEEDELSGDESQAEEMDDVVSSEDSALSTPPSEDVSARAAGRSWHVGPWKRWELHDGGSVRATCFHKVGNATARGTVRKKSYNAEANLWQCDGNCAIQVRGKASLGDWGYSSWDYSWKNDGEVKHDCGFWPCKYGECRVAIYK